MREWTGEVVSKYEFLHVNGETNFAQGTRFGVHFVKDLNNNDNLAQLTSYQSGTAGFEEVLSISVFKRLLREGAFLAIYKTTEGEGKEKRVSYEYVKVQ